jgi:hypothetical protein
MTMRGYLVSQAISRLVGHFPEDAVVRLIGGEADETAQRELLVQGIAATIRTEAKRRGYAIVG